MSESGKVIDKLIEDVRLLKLHDEERTKLMDVQTSVIQAQKALLRKLLEYGVDGCPVPPELIREVERYL